MNAMQHARISAKRWGGEAKIIMKFIALLIAPKACVAMLAIVFYIRFGG